MSGVLHGMFLAGASKKYPSQKTATISASGDLYWIAANPAGNTVFVPRPSTNNVSVISTSSNTITATISVGESPRAVAFSPDGATAYVVNTSAGTVSKINTSDNTVSATITAGTTPFGVIVRPDNARAYVANFSSSDVSVINTSTNAVVATISLSGQPSGQMAVSSDGSKVYVTGQNIWVINTSNNTVSATISINGNQLACVLSKDNSKLYVSNQTGGGVVSVVNTSTNSVVSTITNVGTFLYGIAATSDGKRLYVSDYSSDSYAASNDNVFVIDTSTDAVISSIQAGNGNYGLCITPDDNAVYVAASALSGAGGAASISVLT